MIELFWFEFLYLERWPRLTLLWVLWLSLGLYFLHAHVHVLTHKGSSLVLAEREMAVICAALVTVPWRLIALAFISKRKRLTGPLRTLLMPLIFLKLLRKIEITSITIIIIVVCWLIVGQLMLVVSISHNDVHFLRLHNVLLHDIIRRMIVINRTRWLSLFLSIIKTYLPRSLPLYFLVFHTPINLTNFRWLPWVYVLHAMIVSLLHRYIRLALVNRPRCFVSINGWFFK